MNVSTSPRGPLACLASDTSGAVLVEYALITALLSLVCLAALVFIQTQLLGQALRAQSGFAANVRNGVL